MNLSEEITDELVNDIAFYIPIKAFGKGIPVSWSVVSTWVVMAIIIVAGALLARDLVVVPTKEKPISKRQLLMESCVTSLNNFFDDTLGKDGRMYVPYLATVLVFLGVSNITSTFGFNVAGVFEIKPPTKDLGVTAALALMSIFLIEFANIHSRGGIGFLKSFAEPSPILVPINIMEIGIRPLSLCMRLFGNVLGSFVIMTLLEIVLKHIKPIIIPLSLYFDFFDGFIQAYVFVFLTSLFMSDGMKHEE